MIIAITMVMALVYGAKVRKGGHVVVPGLKKHHLPQMKHCHTLAVYPLTHVNVPQYANDFCCTSRGQYSLCPFVSQCILYPFAPAYSFVSEPIQIN